VDSPRGSRDVTRSFGVSPERTVVLPFTSIVKSWGVPTDPPGDYVIYPAQFWPHKNHVVLLEALSALLSSRRKAPRLLFVGDDKGNRNFIEERAHALGVWDLVEFAGFLSAEELRSRLLQARGLVMPSYFGPTNLPPIEALLSGIPVAVSTSDAVSEYADGAAIQGIEPSDVEGWADALEFFAMPGLARPTQVPTDLKDAEPAHVILDRVFSGFVSKRSTWCPDTYGWQ
jgi:glycosyltransferase involved in cell wall biosynthesis